MNDIAISIKNVSKYYKLYNAPQDRLKEALSLSNKIYHKKFYATKNLNLEIKKGEILGIVGKNGSGKSTLLKLITGVLVPDEGSIKVNGNISALLELGSGFNPEFTGVENIFFYGTILGFSKEEMEKKLDDIIAFADIGDFINQPLKSYSSGMKSRLGFAVAIHIEPEILILDEVLAVGDVFFQRKCYAKMEEFFKAGKTIIYVSHNANSVNDLCTKAIFLDAGQILLESVAKEVTGYYQKYLFSNASEKEILKKNMLNLHKTHNEPPIQTQPVTQNIEESSDLFFIKGLQSKTSVRTGDLNVNIYGFSMETLDGKPINVLHFNEEYIFSFNIKFNDHSMPLDGIGFDMQIKDVKGKNISGTNTKRLSQDLPTLNAMYAYKISWSFKANLNARDYFIHAGITLENHNKISSAKVLDAFVFKVIQEQSNFSGLTYLSQSFAIKKLDNEPMSNPPKITN